MNVAHAGVREKVDACALPAPVEHAFDRNDGAGLCDPISVDILKTETLENMTRRVAEAWGMTVYVDGAPPEKNSSAGAPGVLGKGCMSVAKASYDFIA